MLTAEENDILTRVGPQTPMGETMRRYWLPICASSQLPEPDGSPLRAQLLGQSFVVFRDTAGKVGVLDEYCMHRGVSLALGRVEGHGIRCLYHGWKFGADGTILDTPNHCSERFKQRLKAPAYPVREEGGLVWTYIGPKEKIPPFQRYAFMNGPDENRVVIRINANANYLQLFEGGTDSSHVGILHSNMANPTWMTGEFTPSDEDYNPGALSVADNAPTLEIEDTEYGYHYVAKRKGPTQKDGSPTHSIRITPVIFPTCRIIPSPSYQFFVFEIPQSDHRTSTYLISHGPRPVERSEILRIMGLDDDRFWNEKNCEFNASWDNHLGQNREAMKQSWSGYSGIEQEDVILAISMGPIIDRTKEHLVAADRAIVHLRARLLESIRLVKAGGDPIGVNIRDYTNVVALADTVITPDASWQAWVPNNMGIVGREKEMA
jgi:phthalate 4,5-dioxygenase oxygenase subunit